MVIENIVRGNVITIEFENVEKYCDEVLADSTITVCDYLDINAPILLLDDTHAVYFIPDVANTFTQMYIYKIGAHDKYWHWDWSKIDA